MSPEIRKLRKCFGAECTLVRLLSCVSTCMRVEISGARECFTAVCAFPFSSLRVPTLEFHMSVQVHLTGEHSPTLLTLVT